ncbi:MAG: NUDIX hydrolase, partial [Dietzia sp.]
MSGEVILLVVVLVILAVTALLVAYLTAHRLDRLHIRTDLARAALVGALERRHTVTAAIVADLTDRDPGSARQLSNALALARAHPPDAVTGGAPRPEPEPELGPEPEPEPARRGRPSTGRPGDDGAPDAERAENTLGTLLSGLDVAALPADLAAELG